MYIIHTCTYIYVYKYANNALPYTHIQCINSGVHSCTSNSAYVHTVHTHACMHTIIRTPYVCSTYIHTVHTYSINTHTTYMQLVHTIYA